MSNFQVETIESFDDPRLLPYRNMRRQFDHAAQEIFIAEGDKVVERLLESAVKIISVLLPTKRLAEFQPLLEKRAEKISVFTADIQILENLVGFPLYQGVLALAQIPKPATLEELLLRETPRFFVAADNFSNAENMGVLTRNAVAFGAQALIVSETCATPYLRRAVRNSMGTIFKIPFLQTANLAETILQLRRQKIRCIAAHPHTEQRFISDVDFRGDCCVVFGSEGAGLSPAVIGACDETAAIPMRNEVDSLNVASAAAVFLYEVQRQRQKSR